MRRRYDSLTGAPLIKLSELFSAATGKPTPQVLSSDDPYRYYFRSLTGKKLGYPKHIKKPDFWYISDEIDVLMNQITKRHPGFFAASSLSLAEHEIRPSIGAHCLHRLFKSTPERPREKAILFPININHNHWVSCLVFVNDEGHLEILYNNSLDQADNESVKDRVLGTINRMITALKAENTTLRHDLKAELTDAKIYCQTGHDSDNCGPITIHTLGSWARNFNTLKPYVMQQKAQAAPYKLIYEEKNYYLGELVLNYDRTIARIREEHAALIDAEFRRLEQDPDPDATRAAALSARVAAEAEAAATAAAAATASTSTPAVTTDEGVKPDTKRARRRRRDDVSNRKASKRSALDDATLTKYISELLLSELYSPVEIEAKITALREYFTKLRAEKTLQFTRLLTDEERAQAAQVQSVSPMKEGDEEDIITIPASSLTDAEIDETIEEIITQTRHNLAEHNKKVNAIRDAFLAAKSTQGNRIFSATFLQTQFNFGSKKDSKDEDADYSVEGKKKDLADKEWEYGFLSDDSATAMIIPEGEQYGEEDETGVTFYDEPQSASAAMADGMQVDEAATTTSQSRKRKAAAREDDGSWKASTHVANWTEEEERYKALATNIASLLLAGLKKYHITSISPSMIGMQTFQEDWLETVTAIANLPSRSLDSMSSMFSNKGINSEDVGGFIELIATCKKISPDDWGNLLRIIIVMQNHLGLPEEGEVLRLYTECSEMLFPGIPVAALKPGECRQVMQLLSPISNLQYGLGLPKEGVVINLLTPLETLAEASVARKVTAVKLVCLGCKHTQTTTEDFIVKIKNSLAYLTTEPSSAEEKEAASKAGGLILPADKLDILKKGDPDIKTNIRGNVTTLMSIANQFEEPEYRRLAVILIGLGRVSNYKSQSSSTIPSSDQADEREVEDHGLEDEASSFFPSLDDTLDAMFREIFGDEDPLQEGLELLEDQPNPTAYNPVALMAQNDPYHQVTMV